MNCSNPECEGTTAVIDSRTPGWPHVPARVPELLPAQWWRWRRHRCTRCATVRQTIEIPLERLEQIVADQTGAPCST